MSQDLDRDAQVRITFTPGEIQRIDAARGSVPRAPWVGATLVRVLSLPKQGRELPPAPRSNEHPTVRVAPRLSPAALAALKSASAGVISLGQQARELVLRALDYGEDLPSDPGPR